MCSFPYWLYSHLLHLCDVPRLRVLPSPFCSGSCLVEDKSADDRFSLLLHLRMPLLALNLGRIFSLVVLINFIIPVSITWLHNSTGGSVCLARGIGVMSVRLRETQEERKCSVFSLVHADLKGHVRTHLQHLSYSSLEISSWPRPGAWEFTDVLGIKALRLTIVLEKNGVF